MFAGVDFFLAGDLAMGTFLRMFILVRVDLNDFTIRGGAMECCLKEGPIFRSDCSRFNF